MTIAYEAMVFAREMHKSQKRKYTGNPYIEHLAEVAGIAACFTNASPLVVCAVAWLHDCVEDQGVSLETLNSKFGSEISNSVMLLSDMEIGNRAERKSAARQRLATAPGWVQTIKVADLISNTKSIYEHDRKFSILFNKEKNMLLDVLSKADPYIVSIARKEY